MISMTGIFTYQQEMNGKFRVNLTTFEIGSQGGSKAVRQPGRQAGARNVW